MRPHSRPAPLRTIADYPGVARAARAWGCSLMMGQPNADEKAALSRVPARPPKSQTVHLQCVLAGWPRPTVNLAPAVLAPPPAPQAPLRARCGFTRAD
jgi:hypothetical protein